MLAKATKAPGPITSKPQKVCDKIYFDTAFTQLTPPPQQKSVYQTDNYLSALQSRGGSDG